MVEYPCNGGKWLNPTNTDTQGNYILIVPAGNYYLVTSPSCFGSNSSSFYPNEWWNSGSGTFNCNDGAEPLNVVALQTYSNHNFAVGPGAKLSGTVVALDTQEALVGACVSVVQDSCGGYNSSVFYVDQWWNPASGSFKCSGGQLETVNAYDQKAFHFVVPKGAKIIGNVIAEDDSQPIPDVCVNVTEAFCGGYWYTPSNSDSNGFYSLLVPEGSDFLYARPNCGNFDPLQAYLAEWWNTGSGSPGCNGADTINISSGEVGTSVTRNFALAEGFTISGRVTTADTNEGLANVCVNAQDGCEGIWQGGGNTDSQGYYSFNLTPGSYYIGIDMTCGGNNPPSVYLSEWWDGADGTPNCNESTPVDLTSSSQSGINFALARGGLIGGRVTTTDGTPVEGLWIHAFSSKCWNNHLGGDATDSNGEYWITVPDGDAYIQTCASCNHQNFEDKWWDEFTGTIDCGSAMPVQVESNGTASGNDFVLHAAPQVLSYFEVGPYSNNLLASFDVAPSYRKLIKKATVVGPSPANTHRYDFDLVNDFTDNSNEYGYRISWDYSFGPVQAEDFGDYTLTLTLFDGSVRTYHDVVYDKRSDVPGPVDSNTMNTIVHDDGSIDFQWAWPSEPWPKSYYYRLRIRSIDGQDQYFNSGIMAKGDPQLHVPVDSLSCLERGQTYKWFLRIMDSQWPYNVVWDSERVSLAYTNSLTSQRTSYVDVWQWDGKLALGFDVRSGSWDDISWARVVGPNSFFYEFDLVNDWSDISTETRTNRSWWKEFDPPFDFGEYTLQVEFKDGHTDELSKTIVGVPLALVPNDSLSYDLFEDGSMAFSWNLGAGDVNQRYNVRVRNLDGSREYVRTPNAIDFDSTSSSFLDLRALDFGETFKWFIRYYDQQSNNMITTDSVSFVYNPFNYQADWLKDTDGDGMNDGWENDHGLNYQVKDGDGDPDGDLLTNLEEYRNNTDPHVQDSDGDGMKDKWEVDNWLNPALNDALEDPDGDGFNNRMESIHGTDPNDKESRPITTTGVFRPSNGLIYLKSENNTGYADAELVYGIPEDIPVAGDWDGDGIDSIGIYRNGVFYLKNSNETGYADMVFAFGADGDLPVAGDWDGDGIDTIGVYRNGLFMLRNTNDSGSADMQFALGIPGDVPLAGDWDGVGGDSCGVFRPTNGLIYLKNDNATGYADIEIVFGIPNDKPIVGDWDGDHIDTIGVYREGAFLLRNSNETGYAELYFALGINGDVPISGKWALPKN